MEKKYASRVLSYDITAGILIIYMILGHIYAQCHTNFSYTFLGKVLGVIIYWFMPWFFFKSGVFYRKRDIRRQIDLDFHKLLIPYLVFSLSGELLYWIGSYFSNNPLSIVESLNNLGEVIMKMGVMEGNPPLWFLLALFVVKSFYNICEHARIHSSVILIVASLIPFYIYYYSLDCPLYYSYCCTGLLFYTLGRMLKEKQFDRFYFGGSLIGYLIIYVFFRSRGDFRTNILTQGNWWLWMISCLFGIIIANNLMDRLGVKNFRFFVFLRYIGKNSMIYYVIHWPIIVLSAILLNISGFNYSDEILLYFTLALEVVLLIATSYLLKYKWFNYIIGRKTVQIINDEKEENSIII